MAMAGVALSSINIAAVSFQFLILRWILYVPLSGSSNSQEKEWCCEAGLRTYPGTMESEMKKVYFVGIGGSGMLPLARLALTRGYLVSGSDAKLSSAALEELRGQGIQAFGPPDSTRIEDGLVVYSTAISETHPERQRAVELEKQGRVELLHRMDFLNKLVSHCSMRLGMAGTHGKTSSTALAGWMLIQLQKEPLIIAGGRPLYLDRAIRNGQTVAVFETDESDGSFLKSNATHRLILNADQDHLNFYGNFENLQNAFLEFAVKGSGTGVIFNAGDSGLVPLRNSTGLAGYRIYENKEQCLQSQVFLAGYFPDSDDTLEFRIRWPESRMQEMDFYRFRLSVPGRHFASNALGVLGLLLLAFPDLDIDDCIEAMGSFPGTERRLECLGEYKGIPVYDDYGHHPSEIVAVLDALAQRFPGHEIRVIFQPHRYTRTRELATEFASSLAHADRVYLLPLYSAGEEPLDGVDSSLIANQMPENCTATLLDDPGQVFETEIDGPSIVLFLGAGDVSQKARALFS